MKSDVIVYGVAEPLLASEIAFCRFDRNMTEKKLNLLQFATGLMAQTRTGPAKIMRRQTGQPRIRRGLLHYGPDNLGSEAVSPGPPSLVDCSEEYPRVEACRRRPSVDSRLHPIRNRHGSDMPALTLQVCDDPVPFAELDFLDLQCCRFRSAETTAD